MSSWNQGRARSAFILFLLLPTLSGTYLMTPKVAVEPARAVSPQTSVTGDATALRAVRRPNVVVLMTDDQRAADLAYMPRTRRLIGRAGITFSQALSPNPLCCPARATFLTGQASQNNRVFTNDKNRYGGYRRLDSRETLPVWLQRAGYNTAFAGKHLNGYSFARHGVDPGWDRFNVLTQGVYNYTSWTALEAGKQVSRRGYVTDYLAGRVASFVQSFSRRRAPFFIWAAHVAPHMAKQGSGWGPPLPAPRHKGRYSYRDFPLDSFDKPSYRESVGDKSSAYRARTRHFSDRRVRAEHLGRVLALKAVDQANARIIRALDATDELDNTVVLFMSDNGYLLGEHRYIGKILGFEETLRVPLLMRGPGIKAGTRASQPVTIMDLTATILGLANARSRRSSDGTDLRPILADPNGATVADTVLIQSGAYTLEDSRVAPWIYRGVRTDRYTLLRYSATGEYELYDRLEDPYQVDNVARRPRYEAVERELRQRLSALRDCRGASCTKSFGPVPDPVTTEE